MTIAVFPALNLAPTQISFYPLGNTRVFSSPNQRFQQRIRLGGELWMCRLNYDEIDDADRRLLDAFLDSLGGAWRTFYFKPYDVGFERLGSGGGTPLVKGADQVGSSLLIDGCVASATIAKMGDYLAFTSNARSELKRLTQDAVSDASGNATLTFAPMIRNSPADNAVIDFDEPRCIMGLEADDHGGVPVHGPMFGQSSLAFIEALWAS